MHGNPRLTHACSELEEEDVKVMMRDIWMGEAAYCNTKAVMTNTHTRIVKSHDEDNGQRHIQPDRKKRLVRLVL